MQEILYGCKDLCEFGKSAYVNISLGNENELSGKLNCHK